MTDSMNFGPEWLRNLSSEGTTTGIGGGGSRCQLADYRYGREDMLALYEKGLPAPPSLAMFPPIYSEQVLPPLALVPATDEERQWATRGPPLGPSTRGGRGAPGIAERGGRVSRGSRGAYQPFGRAVAAGYDGGSGGGGSGWGGANEQTEWSPRKDFTYSRSTSSGGIDNWRRNNRTLSEEEDGWRTTAAHGRGGGGGTGEKWNRSSSWREGDDDVREKRWHEPTAGGGRGGGNRRMWDAQDEHLPEWATENLAEGGGTFDSSGAFHGSDDENERDRGKELQKSASQHNLRNQHAPLVTSKSAVSLSINKSSKTEFKEDKPTRFNPDNEDTNSKDGSPAGSSENELPEQSIHLNEEQSSSVPTGSTPIPPTNPNLDHSNNSVPSESGVRVVDEDFDKLQEDFVSKLVVDEEPHKNAVQSAPNLPNVAMSNGIPPQPPNLMPPPPPSQEKWYYQDPQGDLQGPFLSTEMAEWYKAGYFSTTLFVRRRCDERFYTLGELVALCKGNPFLASLPLLPPKQEKLEDPEVAMHYQQQFLQAQMMRARGAPFGQGEPWAGLPGFQREMFAPPMMPPMAPEMMASATANAPMLHHILNQFKMPAVPVQPPVMDESLAGPNAMHMDPLRALVQQMGGLQTLQNRMQQPGMPAPHTMPANGTVHPPKLDSGKMESTDFMQFMQQHAALSKQQPVQMEKRIDLDSLWKHNQFQQAQQQHPPTQLQQPPPHQHQSANNIQSTPQWSQSDKPISMWDPPTVATAAAMQVHQTNIPPPVVVQQIAQQAPDSPVIDTPEKKNKKEEKKQRELEEKLAKKEAEEKRKQEQRKQELEKKQQDEKRKKEEDRIRKELEKAKKEAEEKRLKELADKKKLKEQRKEEEARKKAAEELKKQEDEKERQAVKEREEFKKQQQIEAQRQMANAATNQKPAKIAPWSQATTNQGLSFTEIQKIERERKAEQVLMLQQQQRQMQQTMQEQVASPEKMNTFGVPLSWANKPMQPNHVKSLSEIQAEEQDRMLKQKEKEKAAQKEKETLSPPTSTIWSGQSLTWNNSDGAGFWDEPVPQPPPPKKAQQPQPIKQIVNRQQPAQQPQQAKKPASKQQKEQANNNANSNNSEMNSSDEFTSWCIRTLANMNTQVDIPTFVSFLRSIESALDVRDYCREYLGEKPATQQFAAHFLEKRRSFKPKQNAHKDDMCSPAPAITPSTQHNNDFQEVKGKGKKCKKSKMLKVDARILGFNVTAAQDRINVGDRDYGES